MYVPRVGKNGFYAFKGDLVKIVSGRKNVGELFYVTNTYSWSKHPMGEPLAYYLEGRLYGKYIYKIQAQHCEIVREAN